MSSNPKSYDLTSPYSLVLSGQSILAEAPSQIPLYQINHNITSIPRTESTVIFERAEHDSTEKEIESNSDKPRNQRLFYLAHPVNAEYRTDIPARYYLTSASPEMMGNVRFETSKSRFQRTEFRVILSPKRTASNAPLFDKETEQVLFGIRSKWNAGRGGYRWTDADGRQVAYEDRKDDSYKLVVIEAISEEMRDALVALWILRLWHNIAESKHAKREGQLNSSSICRRLTCSALEDMTPPETYQSNMKLVKRAGALGSLAGAAC